MLTYGYLFTKHEKEILIEETTALILLAKVLDPGGLNNDGGAGYPQAVRWICH